jgi:hypothetical protein
MSLQLLGHVDLPVNQKPGGFDHAAVHCASGRLYVAHTANDALDVIDCVHDRYLHSIPNLTAVAGALASEQRNLVFTSNRGENMVGIFAADDEAGPAKLGWSYLKHIAQSFTPTKARGPVSLLNRSLQVVIVRKPAKTVFSKDDLS